MHELLLHRSKLESIFELLGGKEDDITYSLGWTLSRSPAFLRDLVQKVIPRVRSTDRATIRLQEHKRDAGRTDVEISTEAFHIIAEAKRGWAFPTKKQLRLYTTRLRASPSRRKALLVMSESSLEYARLHLPKIVGGFPVHFVSWADIAQMTHAERAGTVEKRLLGELRTYIGRIVAMQNQESNRVWVVSLGNNTPSWSGLSWIDIVKEKSRYFHPVGNGYLKEPPNYIAFRYHGKLKRIHHVDAWTITRNLHKQIRELKSRIQEPHFVYTLGPVIKPYREVKNGSIWPSGRVWAALDLLLTSKTIQEAVAKTRKREKEAEGLAK